MVKILCAFCATYPLNPWESKYYMFDGACYRQTNKDVQSVQFDER